MSYIQRKITTDFYRDKDNLKSFSVLRFSRYLQLMKEDIELDDLPPDTEIDLPKMKSPDFEKLTDTESDADLEYKKVSASLSYVLSQILFFYSQFDRLDALEKSIELALKITNTNYTKNFLMTLLDKISRSRFPVNVVVPNNVEIFFTLLKTKRDELLRKEPETQIDLFDLINMITNKKKVEQDVEPVKINPKLK